MSTNNLALSPVELVSTIITVPMNGSPSSEDYNDNSSQNLIDHAALVNAINNEIFPVLNTLPESAANGLFGSSIYTDVSQQIPITFNTTTGTYYTVLDSLLYLAGLIAIIQQQILQLNTEIGFLKAKLAATNQNDISLALQAFQLELQAQEAQIIALQEEVALLSLESGGGITSVLLTGMYPGFTSTFPILPVTILAVFYNGAYLPTTQYSVSGSTLTTGFECYNGDSIYALITT